MRANEKSAGQAVENVSPKNNITLQQRQSQICVAVFLPDNRRSLIHVACMMTLQSACKPDMNLMIAFFICNSFSRGTQRELTRGNGENLIFFFFERQKVD